MPQRDESLFALRSLYALKIHRQPELRRVMWAWHEMLTSGVRFQYRRRESNSWEDAGTRPTSGLGWYAGYEYRIHPADDHLVPQHVVFPWETEASAATEPAPSAARPIVPVSEMQMGDVGRIVGWPYGNYLGAIIMRIGTGGGTRSLACIAQNGSSVARGDTWDDGVLNNPEAKVELLNFQLEGIDT